MTEAAVSAEQSSGDTRLAVLLAMAMFVLVVDTSLMNVSISSVVHDLDATASGVQSNTDLEELLAGEPPAVQEEILEINEDSRPIALQVALLIPLGAALLGLFAAFRMTRLPDPKPSASAEMALGG